MKQKYWVIEFERLDNPGQVSVRCFRSWQPYRRFRDNCGERQLKIINTQVTYMTDTEARRRIVK